MNRIVGLVCGVMLLLGTGVVAVPAEAASVTLDGEIGLRQPRPVPMHSTAADRAATWTAPAAAKVTPTPCKDHPAFLCGSLSVPIDRAHPSHGTLDITFNVIPHRDPASSATDAVFVVSGGPGISTIESDRHGWFSTLDPMAEERDIVLIDARGTGTTALRCPRLQHGKFPPSQLLEAIGACGEHLGPDADRYGTGDVAMDTEAVREALGYPAIDMMMGSYGGVLEQAYAVRFPERVRSIVSQATFPVTDPMHVLDVGLGIPDTYVRAATLNCQRAPSCIGANSDPAALFTWLARRVARHAVVGDALDSSNQLRHVVVDDTELAVIVSASPNLNAEELVGAAQALRDGDPAPLLRLGADSPLGINGDSGPSILSSAGDYAAASCNDVDAPWQRAWSIDHRERAYDRYIASLPGDAFAPLSVRGWEAFYSPNFCILWPAPDRFTPAVPKDAVFPNTPTLVMSGDLDVYVPTSSSQVVADEFPNSTLVSIEGAGHTPTDYSDCALQIAATFVETLSVGDTTCASEPAWVFPVTPAFPVHASDADEAQRIPGGIDRSTASDRRVASAVMRTVPDDFIRTLWYGVSGIVPGLRGGTFLSAYQGSRAKLTFKGERFVDDIAIWGRVSWIYASGKLEGDLKIRGASIGGVHLTGDWSAMFGFGGHYGAIKIRGTIDGRHVALQIPAN